ncbi:MAG: hypothetical protein ABGZ17_06885 [Planctomycetaceae bacterium]
MTESLAPLWLLMERQDAVVSSYAARTWLTDVHATLLTLGVLREAENATWITCPDCFMHEEEVVVQTGPGGQVRYAVPCPEAFRAEVSLEDLRQWRIDVGTVAALVADQLQLAGECTELAPDRVWRLGRWRYQGVMRDMLLARGLDRSDAGNIRRAITGAKRPVVFVPYHPPPSGFWLGKTPPIVRLSEVATFADGQLTLDTSQIIGTIHDADAEASDSVEAVSGHSLSFEIDQKVRNAVRSQLTDDQIIQAYVANGSSARKAAKSLGKQGVSVHHSTISRTVRKYQDVLQSGSSE